MDYEIFMSYFLYHFPFSFHTSPQDFNFDSSPDMQCNCLFSSFLPNGALLSWQYLCISVLVTPFLFILMYSLANPIIVHSLGMLIAPCNFNNILTFYMEIIKILGCSYKILYIHILYITVFYLFSC